MKYRNTKTGAVIEIMSELRGGDWELVDTAPNPVLEAEPKTEPETAPKSKTAGRKGK